MGVHFLFDENLEGHANATRRYHAVALAAGIETTLAGVDSDSFPEANIPEGVNTVVQAGIPPRMKPFSGYRNIAIAYHEWDRMPVAWIKQLAEFDQVWVSSRYLEEVLSRSGFSGNPVYIPVPIDLSMIKAKSSWDANKPFCFVSIGEWHFRKGFHLLSAAFERAFPSGNEAELVIKTSPGIDYVFDNPAIRIISEHLPFDAVNNLLFSADAYITASLAEGLGLPVGEAMAARLPVLAPVWSGLTEYCNSETCLELPYTVQQQIFCSRPDYYAVGQQCAVVDVDACADRMREIVEMSAAEREAITSRAVAHLEKTCSPGISQRLITQSLRNGC